MSITVIMISALNAMLVIAAYEGGKALGRYIVDRRKARK